jgi:transforming growth factor-beta-induced protein
MLVQSQKENSMKQLMLAALLAAAVSPSVLAQDFRPIPNPPQKSLAEALRAAGNFNTFLSLLEAAGFRDLGLTSSGAPSKLASAGPGGGPRTFLAPNDAAFAKLPKGAVEALKNDPARLRSFLLAHVIPGKVMVKDMFEPVENSKKEFKTAEGRVLGFSCNGRHAGMHNPTINGKARVGKFQDVSAAEGVVHEIDAVLVTDGTSR